jgi:predicted nucleotidyltransferase
MQPPDLPALADVVLRLADVFDGLAVPYAIGGAVATSFWGIPRTTQDADCLVAVPAVAYQRLADALNAQGFEIEQPSGPQVVTVVALLEQVRRDKYMTLACRATSVELFVPVVPLQQSILKRAVGRSFHGRTIRVTTAEDLILLKMAFHRQKDIQDIKGILHVQRGQLDMPYVRHWSVEMLESAALGELDDLIETYAADPSVDPRT